MKNLLLYFVFAVSALLVLLNRYTPFYISDYRLHFVVLFLAASTFVVIIGQRYDKLKSAKSIAVAVVVVGLACFLKAYLSWGGDWKTQTILYENIAKSSTSIDYQLRGDRFSFGYKKRIVEVNRLLPGMQWTTDNDTVVLDPSIWKKVDRVVNTIEL